VDADVQIKSLDTSALEDDCICIAQNLSSALLEFRKPEKVRVRCGSMLFAHVLIDLPSTTSRI
jgi:hypothetical protein